MSMDDNNQHDRHSAPESLGQVLNSLQSLLEHKQFPFTGTPDKTIEISEAAIEPFSNQPGELYDDPLSPDDGDDIPLLHTEESNPAELQIPVLDDIIFKGLDEPAHFTGQGDEIENQLKQLRDELEAIVGDIVDEARQQLESGEPAPVENSLQRFLRKLAQQTPG